MNQILGLIDETTIEERILEIDVQLTYLRMCLSRQGLLTQRQATELGLLQDKLSNLRNDSIKRMLDIEMTGERIAMAHNLTPARISQIKAQL